MLPMLKRQGCVLNFLLSYKNADPSPVAGGAVLTGRLLAEESL